MRTTQVTATKSSGEDTNPYKEVIKSVKETTKPISLKDRATRLATAELTQTTDNLLNSVKEAPKPEEDIINPLFNSTSSYKLPYRE